MNVRQFEKRHAIVLIFLLMAGVLAVNVYAFSNAYDSVQQINLSESQAPRVDRELVYPASKAGSDETDESQAQALDSLLPLLEIFVSEQSVPMAIVVQDLSNDELIAVNGTTTYVSASLYKLFVSYEVTRQIALGQASLEQTVGFDAEDESVGDCLWRALSYSDNDCGRALRKFIGASESPIDAVADSGFTSTSLVNEYPTTNARDVALFFERLYDQTEFDASLNDVLLDALKSQQIDDRLPVGIPHETPIAHKTADLEGYSHDAGIIYSPSADYILVVLSGPWPDGYEDAPVEIADISRLVYSFFNQSAGARY